MKGNSLQCTVDSWKRRVYSVDSWKGRVYSVDSWKGRKGLRENMCNKFRYYQPEISILWVRTGTAQIIILYNELLF